MTLDGVIQNEENDGDGFKYGGWFFPFADEVTGAVVQERLAKTLKRFAHHTPRAATLWWHIISIMR